MPTSPFLPLPTGLEIASVQTVGDLLRVQVVSTRMNSPCPLCFCPAQRRHSQYTRVVADLPCAGWRVQLILHVRKFFCERTDCPRKIFSERLPGFVEPWARMTMRLCQAIQAIGRASSAEVGGRLAARLALPTSPTTILRRVMVLPIDSAELVRVLGIDDWSFRRGRKFGTILVDLTSHKVIDLLPDRNSEPAAAWMLSHPEIEIVSRDRGEEYAAAARKGTPQAKSVADRFHLTKNLGEALEPFLERNKVCLRFTEQAQAATQGQGQASPPQPPAPGEIRPAPSKKEEEVRLAHRQARRERYEQAIALREQGFKIADIASRIGVHRRTVERFLAAPSFPEKKRRRPERTKLEAYHP
jgi:transposase